MNINDFFISSGDDTRKAMESNPRQKTNYVNLKDGDSLRGFLLTSEFKMYMVHGDYEKHIKSHTCKNPKNLEGHVCLSCMHGVKRSKKAIVPFYNVDTQQVEVFVASLTALKAIYVYVDEFEEDSTTTPIALTRSGSDKTTTYTLMATRVRPAEKMLFRKPTDIILDKQFYARALNIPDDDYVKKLIHVQYDEPTNSVESSSNDQTPSVLKVS